MLNMLISIMGETFSRVTANETMSSVFERLQIIAESDKLESEANLLKMYGNNEEYLMIIVTDKKEVEPQDESGNLFQFS